MQQKNFQQLYVRGVSNTPPLFFSVLFFSTNMNIPKSYWESERSVCACAESEVDATFLLAPAGGF